MAIHYRDPKTGEYEVIKIPVMKGDQGHAGIHVGTETPPTTDIKLWFDPSDTDNDVDLANRLETTLTACYDYMGNDRGSIKDAADANVEYILGEVNTHHYEGQHITATDTIERQVKRAGLKGQTLVNLMGKLETDLSKNRWVDDGNNYTLNLPTGNGQPSLFFRTRHTLSANKTYTLFINMTTHTAGILHLILRTPDNISSCSNQCYFGQVGWQKLVFTTTEESGYIQMFNRNLVNNNFSISKNLILLEGDHTNTPVPNYFEGMASVKAPTVKMNGKNLFDIDNAIRHEGVIIKDNSIHITKNRDYPDNVIYTFENAPTESVLTFDLSSNGVQTPGGALASIWYEDGTNIWITVSTKVYVNTKKITCIKIHNWCRGTHTFSNIQLEEGTQASSFKPYKSNALTTPNDLVLRKLGGVEDTVDLNAGRMTQRIGEIELNGNEDWAEFTGQALTNTKLFASPQISNIRSNGAEITLNNDSFASLSPNTGGLWDTDVVGFSNCIVSSNFRLRLPKSIANTVVELKAWLAKNPIKVQYILETPIIKSIDLQNQKIYSYDGTTHYTCSSAESLLVPTLSIDVPTNLPALVTKQRHQIETLEKENQALSNELELAITSSNEVDNALLAQSFELDFRIMEVESALNLPMAATFQLGGKTMAMTPYDMAKKLILAGNYKRSDMERKLNVYVSKKRMTEVERQELIQLMNEAEDIIADEPEAEEFVTEHEAATIPLH